MSAVDEKMTPSNQRNNNGSQHTYNEQPLEEDQKTLQVKDEDVRTENNHYPAVLECAPFPALGSLEEITQTLSRVKSNQAQKNFNTNEKSDVYLTEDMNTIEKDVFKQEEYHTDGIRNPGWLTVLSCFLVNFFVFGSCFSWGIYQKFDIYAGQTDLLRIAFVGTSASALLLALGMFITPVIQKIGFRGTMAIGTIVSPLALILASFATELWHVYLSQGILFGLGSAFVFSPSVTLPSQWFTSKRALATGIAVSGSGIGGVCLSPMIQSLIVSVGFRNTLRIQGAFGFGLLCISTALATSRYRPPPSSNGKNKWYHIYDSSLISRRFVLLLAFSFFVPFGYVAPFFLAPSYCEYIGLDPSTGAVMISVMSAANAICRITLGYLADRSGRFNTMLICTMLAGIFTMVIWQLATTYTIFAVYCVLYGLTAGGFVSLLPVTCADIVGVENIQKGLGMAYMTTVIGNLLGTPIIGLLQGTFGWTAAIQFAGAMAIVSSVFMFILRMSMSKGKLFAKV
ncbi:hypothetical protein INT48_002101 [Thamnidium elegans]|uniref:Major facilitator superfamily (MFS) profile domain-containing protein n=1 Tax=Thamnidium elegans TaxID=101142 RepID=A0A8H7VYB0_9FUNG|nr:hypothetical protein INT48_002101 [Thamnidium elegans]